MKTELVHAAAAVVPNQQILVNMVSRRVRQLSLGHRPLVEFAPGLGLADVALMEIANGKLAFEPAPQKPLAGAEIVEFPGIITKVTKKAA
ncbi:MAG TPA: DNA-directed RNA polymerase subunit omega [Chthoniobacterales bacterium]|jgi:DNA-directed RNA polymerase subunit omega